MKHIAFALLVLLIQQTVSAQFALPANCVGTTAIYKDSSVFVAWASACTLTLGKQNIADSTSPLASNGTANDALGIADITTVSLGDGGEAILTFNQPIYNGAGADFAVFENGFYTGGPSMAFLELAFVEVSSDGVRFVRFPAVSNVEDTTQYAMQPMDGSRLNNLAGKYVGGYGTPFDLEELKDSVGLDVNHITHVKVIDVVGDINPQFARRDKNSRIINDPYPTPFPSGGFDLDAVGVLHAVGISDVATVDNAALRFNLFPNPVKKGEAASIQYNIGNEGVALQVFNLLGEKVWEKLITNNTVITVPTSNLSTGIYVVRLVDSGTSFSTKFVVN